jgi:hypothetical protein
MCADCERMSLGGLYGPIAPQVNGGFAILDVKLNDTLTSFEAATGGAKQDFMAFAASAGSPVQLQVQLADSTTLFAVVTGTNTIDQFRYASLAPVSNQPTYVHVSSLSCLPISRLMDASARCHKSFIYKIARTACLVHGLSPYCPYLTQFSLEPH